MMHRQLLTPRKLVLFAYDLGVTLFSAYLAILILNQSFSCLDLQNFKMTWPLFPILGAILFFLFGYYDQMWVYASLPQYVMLASGTLIQTFFVTMLMQILGRRLHFVTYVLYFFLVTMGIMGIRLSYRMWVHYKERHFNSKHQKEWAELSNEGNQPKTLNVLVVGAGQAGNLVIKELQEHQTLRVPVALVDDNPGKQGLRNLGVPVLGSTEMIPEIVKQYGIDEIILAIPSASPEVMRALVKRCRETKARLKTVPFLPEILSGKLAVSEFRDLELTDLLGRDPVVLESESIETLMRDKVVLVTGGGGSIGSELVRQMLPFRPKQIILLDIYENNVYNLQQEIKEKVQELSIDLKVLIGSVRDLERLEEIFETYRPQLVFHAAAHKHVPLMEDSRQDAVKNNVYGTYHVAEMAGRYRCEGMILISTDKAVHPTNCMGATKRLAEMILLAMDRQFPDTRFVAVRFGNVLGSAGSVIPLFQRQIREERRVTLTHPDIRRYFMTIPEAAGLVLQAAAYAKGGEIFVLDMGEPVKIMDLAKELIRFNGCEPDVDIPIEIIGLRPGEKLFEELFLDKEHCDRTQHAKIFVLQQIHDQAALTEEREVLLNLIMAEPEALRRLTDVVIQTIAAPK